MDKANPGPSHGKAWAVRACQTIAAIAFTAGFGLMGYVYFFARPAGIAVQQGQQLNGIAFVILMFGFFQSMSLLAKSSGSYAFMLNASLLALLYSVVLLAVSLCKRQWSPPYVYAIAALGCMTILFAVNVLGFWKLSTSKADEQVGR